MEESLRRNGLALIVDKRVWNAVLGFNLKKDRMISVHFQGKPFSITVIQVYAPTSNAEQAEVEWYYEDITRPSKSITKRRYPFHYRGLESKSRKSRHTWRNKQVWTWSTKWSRAKANRVFPGECTGKSKHHLPTTQEKTTHGHHQRVNNEIRFCSQRGRCSIQSAKTRLGANYGSDHELLIAKFRFKLNEVGKINWPFRYDLNQMSMIIQWKWEIDSRD